MTENYLMLVGGEFHAGAGRAEVIDPALGQPFESYPYADEALIDKAVDCAADAFPAWAALPHGARAGMLAQVGQGMIGQAEALAHLFVREQGRPFREAMEEVMGSAYTLLGFAQMAPMLEPKVIRNDDSHRIVEHRAPLGVVAAIIPWNGPLQLLSMKLGPALLAGNTIVIKPAGTTPLTTLALARIVAEILPPGVVNVVCDRNDMGDHLCKNPRVAKIAFTGSTNTGRKVFAAAADTFKRLTLELGGNDAAIVLDDVDPVRAAKALFAASMANAGQVCLATKRAYVPAAAYEAICDELVTLANNAVVGSGLDPATQIGPLQNAAQFERTKAILRILPEEAEVIAGGHTLNRPGYFVAPTIVRNCKPDARIVHEEQFAPILPVIPYTDVLQVIAEVNAGPYGLGATIWSNDVEKAAELGARLEVGTTWINQHMAFGPDTPFRGLKASGIGVELGEEGLLEYTQARLVNSVPLSA